MDAAFVVHARIEARHVAGRRHEDVALVGIVDLNPREVVSAVLAVPWLGQLVDSPCLDGLGRIKQGEAITHLLAVRQDRVLNGRISLTGCDDDVDLFDLFEGMQTGAGSRPLVLAHVESGAAGFALTLFVLAHVEHKTACAPVVEEAVDGVGEVVRIGEVTEILRKRCPVRAEHRLIHRALATLPDEPHRARANCLDRLARPGNLFDVYAGGQVLRRHWFFLLASSTCGNLRSSVVPPRQPCDARRSI